MKELTKRQRACLDALIAYKVRTGIMPTVEELRSALGLSSKSAAARLLLRLEHRGAIKRAHGCRRAIVLKRAVCPYCGNDIQGHR